MSKLLRLATLTAALMLVASMASAAGINLLWNDCALGGGVQNKTFACTSNTGTNSLYASFIPPAGITAATGVETVIDLLVENTATLSGGWWAFKNASTCRQTALSSSADFTSNTGCTDYWQGLAAGGVTAYIQSYSGNANRARLLAIYATAVANATSMDSNLEYYGVKFNISNAKTVGTGACSGCLDKVCLVFNSIKVTQPAGVGDFVISDEATGRTATWQNEVAGTCLPVPVKNRTWGAVKSLYR